MSSKATDRLAWWLLRLAACTALSGCALGPLATSNGGDAGELHSGSCTGIALERRERQTRIATLETAVHAELGGPPATVVQALQRMGPTPEKGTAAYGELTAERSRLEALEHAATRIQCPAEVAKLP